MWFCFYQVADFKTALVEAGGALQQGRYVPKGISGRLVLKVISVSECCTLQHVLFWISSRVTVWLQLSKSCTVAERVQYKLCLLVHESLLGQSTSWTCWHQSPTYTHTICTTCLVLWQHRHTADNGHVDELATELFLLPHHMHGSGTSCQQTSSCCGWQTHFVENWKHFCLSLFGHHGTCWSDLFCDASSVYQ